MVHLRQLNILLTVSDITSVVVLQSAIKAKLVELGAYVGEYFKLAHRAVDL